MTDLERLLYEGEGDALDFKSAQYPFVNATDQQKAELLKDILAMVNSWRRTEGYIVIGVQEVPGQRATVVGLTEQLDDADLQQFVNNKTNARVEFAYQNVTLDGTPAAVIRVPVQHRPRFLNRDFGGLKKGVVYLRRGSSTAEAMPDEIAQMGAAAIEAEQLPLLVPFLASPKIRARLPEPFRVSSLVLDIPKAKDVPNYRIPRPEPDPLLPAIYRTALSIDPFPHRTARPEYYRHLATFTQTNRLMSPMHFAVENVGGKTAHDVRMRVRLHDPTGAVMLMSEEEYPSVPESSSSHLDYLSHVGRLPPSYDYFVERVGDDWIAEVRVEKVQPKDTHWFFEPLYFGGMAAGDYSLEVTLFADNLPTPIVRTITLCLSVESRTVDLDGILELERERIRGSKEYQELERKATENGLG